MSFVLDLQRTIIIMGLFYSDDAGFGVWRHMRNFLSPPLYRYNDNIAAA